MKNILFVSPYFYPEEGGLELYAFKTAEYLSRKRKVIVLCSTKQESKIEDFNSNLKVIRQRPNFLISNTPISFGLKNSIESIIKRYNIDIINGFSPVPFYADTACYVAKKYNIPFILHYRASSLYKNRPLLDLMSFFYDNLFQKRLFNNSKRIIFASQYPLDRLSEHKKKSLVIPSPIDTSLFKKNDLKREENILFVGQLNKSHKWKGLENLIKAFSLFSNDNNYMLSIIGHGDYAEHYKRLAKRLNLEDKIKFLGRLSQEAIIKYYQTCSFVVIPSISNVEGTPTVLFEAMACAAPTIGGNVGGIPYIIKKDKCGLVVNAKNIEELSKAMGDLANNERLHNKLSYNCLKNIKQYDKETVLKRISNILQNEA